MDLQTLLDRDDNCILDAEGKVHGLEGRSVQEGEDGTLKIAANNCIISYVNCRTKRTEIVVLKKGDTFFYGDWNGHRCVRKVYRCH